MMLLLIVGCIQNRVSKEAAFWGWFQTNEVRLFEFENDRERIFDELRTQLDMVEPGLTFEFGPKEQGKREFVISADGVRERFPSVMKLADAAPSLPRWKITKFRQRSDFQGSVSFNGLEISPEQLKFTIEPDGNKVGLTVFMDGYTADEHLKYAGVVYLMLDQTLGEYDVETKVGFIELKPSSATSKLAKQSFSALRPEFDKLVESISKE